MRPRSGGQHVWAVASAVLLLALAGSVAGYLQVRLRWFEQRGHAELLTFRLSAQLLWIACWAAVAFAFGWAQRALARHWGRSGPGIVLRDPHGVSRVNLRRVVTKVESPANLLAALLLGVTRRDDWMTLLPYVYKTPFETLAGDGRDVGYYVFDEPFYRVLFMAALWTCALGFALALTIYVAYAAWRIPHAQRHIAALATLCVGLTAACFAPSPRLQQYVAVTQQAYAIDQAAICELTLPTDYNLAAQLAGAPLQCPGASDPTPDESNDPIREQLHQLTPFLAIDGASYLVVRPNGASARVYTGYTVSDRYPGSAPHIGPSNYLRAAATVLVDEGPIPRFTFYLSGDGDPIARSWARAFKHALLPSDALGNALRRQLRYPRLLFGVQSQVFAESTSELAAARSTDMRCLALRLPGETADELSLVQPFVVRSGGTASTWLIARGYGGATRLIYAHTGMDAAAGARYQPCRHSVSNDKPAK